MPRLDTIRLVLFLALFFFTFQSTPAQQRDDDLCRKLAAVVNASKTGFASMVGDPIHEDLLDYSSKLELPGWSDGSVYPRDPEGPYVVFVSLGGNDLSEIKKQYRWWISRLRPCLPRWKRAEIASRDDVKSVFRKTREGPSIELEYNIEPSQVGDTKFDLYLRFMAAASVVEKNFCGDLSNLINVSRTNFASLIGAVEDEEQGSYASTIPLPAWGNGSVYPKAADPHVLYVMLGSNQFFEVKSRYARWVSKLTTCLPGWKRTVIASREDVKSVFRETAEGPEIELEYNVKPSKVGSTKYDLYLTVTMSRSEAPR